jgi:hypothetical protein
MANMALPAKLTPIARRSVAVCAAQNPAFAQTKNSQILHY